jgi:hypothetical protein
MSEHLQQKALVSWFKLQYPKLMLIAIPNGSHLAGDAKIRAIKMHKMKAEGLTVGAPDLMLVKASKDYHGLFIEMKWAQNKQSDAQKDMQQYCLMRNYQYKVCYSWEVAKFEIEEYLK